MGGDKDGNRLATHIRFDYKVIAVTMMGNHGANYIFVLVQKIDKGIGVERQIVRMVWTRFFQGFNPRRDMHVDDKPDFLALLMKFGNLGFDITINGIQLALKRGGI